MRHREGAGKDGSARGPMGGGGGLMSSSIDGAPLKDEWQRKGEKNRRISLEQEIVS